MDDVIPAVGRITPGWVDFFITAGAIALVGIGALIWLFFFRKPGRRRRKYRHHHRDRPPSTTLAENGGLPPVRSKDRFLRRPPTHEP